MKRILYITIFILLSIYIFNDTLPETNIFPIIITVIGIMLLILFVKNKSTYFKINIPKQNKTYIDENGYRRFTDSNKLVHRYVAEKEIGRKLNRGEIVHHKNRNKLDNSPENLQIFENQEEHDKYHKRTDWQFKLFRRIKRRMFLM